MSIRKSDLVCVGDKEERSEICRTLWEIRAKSEDEVVLSQVRFSKVEVWCAVVTLTCHTENPTPIPMRKENPDAIFFLPSIAGEYLVKIQNKNIKIHNHL